MDALRKRAILAAEDRFARRERLCRRLALQGVYLIGPLTCPDRLEWETLELRTQGAGSIAVRQDTEKTANRGKESRP